MFFTMMHKTYPVLDFEIKLNKIHSIIRIHNEERIPLNLINHLDEERLEKWIQKRFIPDQRLNFRNLYKEVYRKNFWSILKYSGGFNLSDQYWFREDEMNISWEKNNYFTNPFSYDIGNYLIIGQPIDRESVIISPDLFTNGNNPKTWRMKNEERFLLKGSMYKNGYDCINEKIIADYINALNIPFTSCPETTLTKIKDEVFCCSKNFITKNTELIPAHYITEYNKKNETTHLYHHLEDMCKELKIPNTKPFLNTMLALDSITCQSDRHLGNFGFIRNVDTLEFIGPAPLYDNGNCLWFKDDLEYIGNSLFDINCKPFAHFHKDQDRFIDDKEIIKYFDIDLFEEILKRNLKEPKRTKEILKEVIRRTKDLEKIVISKDREKRIEREEITR